MFEEGRATQIRIQKAVEYGFELEEKLQISEIECQKLKKKLRESEERCQYLEKKCENSEKQRSELKVKFAEIGKLL
jgi:hypothetical protein